MGLCPGWVTTDVSSSIDGVPGSPTFNTTYVDDGMDCTARYVTYYNQDDTRVLLALLRKIGTLSQKIGKYVPTLCGGGVFNYRGATVGPPAASISLAKWQQADTRTGYSQGTFAEISSGEVATAGYGQQGQLGGPQEHYMFAGVGFKAGAASANFSEFGSDGPSVGISLEGEHRKICWG